MGFFRKVAGLFGFGKDEVNKDGDEEEDDNDNRARDNSNYQATGLPRKGFSVPVQVAVERPNLGPVLVPCGTGDGGVQGLQWYAKYLKIDEDGDVAHEFLDEVLETSTPTEGHGKQLMPKFQLHCGTRPAKVKDQVMAHDGRIQHCIEHQGRLTWI